MSPEGILISEGESDLVLSPLEHLVARSTLEHLFETVSEINNTMGNGRTGGFWCDSKSLLAHVNVLSADCNTLRQVVREARKVRDESLRTDSASSARYTEPSAVGSSDHVHESGADKRHRHSGYIPGDGLACKLGDEAGE